MSQLPLFTRESIIRVLPDLLDTDTLLPGSLAVTGFVLSGFKGEIFDPWRDDSGCLDHDVEVIVHGDKSYPPEIVGLTRAEVEICHRVESDLETSLQAVALLGLNRSFRFKRKLFHTDKSK